MMSHVVSRSAPGASPLSPPAARPPKMEHGEDEVSDKARERRLRERLKKWERGDSGLWDDLPKLTLPEDGDDGASSVIGGSGISGRGDSGVVILGGGAGGGQGFPGLGSFISLFMSSSGRMSGPSSRESGSGKGGNGGGGGSSDAQTNSRFFRTTVVVPETRSVAHERSCRTARRREINELTMRRGVNAVGGELERMERKLLLQHHRHHQQEHQQAIEAKEGEEEHGESNAVSEDAQKLWEEWGKKM